MSNSPPPFTYQHKVLKLAWRDFKVKKRHKGYENLAFSTCLCWAHKRVKNLSQYIDLSKINN